MKNKMINRICDILNLFNSDTQSLSIKEVSCKLSINRSTVNVIMSNLQSVGILSRSGQRKKYRMGKKIIDWGRIYLSNIDLKAIAMPYMHELHKKTGEEVLLWVIHGNIRKCIYWIESNKPVRHVIDPQQTEGFLHAGACGKLLLAYLPDKKIEKIIEETGLPSLAKNTITNKYKLLKEIKGIREKEFSYAFGESEDFLWGVAAPIRDYKGNVIAALSVGTLVTNYSLDLKKKYIKIVIDMANEISNDMGYQIYL